MEQPKETDQPKMMDQITLHANKKGQQMDRSGEAEIQKRWIQLYIYLNPATAVSQFQHRQQLDGNSQQNHIYSPILKTTRIN
nr:hypothetical protein BaRGS_013160 [Batillaria attramentaria]